MSRHMMHIIELVLVLGLAVIRGEDGLLGDVSSFSRETPEDQWTDLDVKKLDAQSANHEAKVRWEELDQRKTAEQPELNPVHVRQHPAEVHVAHMRSNPGLDVQFHELDDKAVKEIRLGGVGVQHPGDASKSATLSILLVVGLGLTAFAILVVLIRVRSARNGAGGDAEGGTGAVDLAWDDSALNIIVNPMEEQGNSATMEYDDQELHALRDDFSEDSESEREELDLERDMEDLSSDDDDEAVPGVAVASTSGVKELRSCRGLEWDDSTI